MRKAEIEQIRSEIIMAYLPHVAFDGWAWAPLCAQAQEIGYDAHMVQAVFPGGVQSVLEAFSALMDTRMLEKLEGLTVEDLRVRDRIKRAVLTRLECLAPHKEAVRESLSFWAIPTRKFMAAKIVWRTADEIWNWAGDTSADYNHYTKRGLLSGILVSTTLIWLDDDSGDGSVTAEFLDRRIEDVMKMGKFIGRFKGVRA